MKPILQWQSEEGYGQYSWSLSLDFSYPRIVSKNVKSGFRRLATTEKRVHMLVPMGKESFSGKAVPQSLPEEDLNFFWAW